MNNFKLEMTFFLHLFLFYALFSTCCSCENRSVIPLTKKHSFLDTILANGAKVAYQFKEKDSLCFMTVTLNQKATRTDRERWKTWKRSKKYELTQACERNVAFLFMKPDCKPTDQIEYAKKRTLQLFQVHMDASKKEQNHPQQIVLYKVEATNKVQDNHRIRSAECDKIIDSLLNQIDLCEKSYVSYLNYKSIYCGTELYNSLLDKSIDNYKKSFEAIDYEKLECIVKFTDGALSEYAGSVLKIVFIENPKELSDHIYHYAKNNDTSYVWTSILLEVTDFGNKEEVINAIKKLYQNENQEKKSFLKKLLNDLK